MRPTAGSSTADTAPLEVQYRTGAAQDQTPQDPATEPAQLAFLFDLGDPLCYFAAERVLHVMPVVAEWQPVHAAAIGLEPSPVAEEDLTRWAQQLELLPLRLPEEMPPDTEQAMLAATYAKAVGRTVAFAQAAFRQAFAGGRDLGDERTVLIAGAACEMHPNALLKGIALRSTREALARTGATAQAAGVTQLPAILTPTEVFCGPACVEEAAAALTAGLA